MKLESYGEPHTQFKLGAFLSFCCKQKPKGPHLKVHELINFYTIVYTSYDSTQFYPPGRPGKLLFITWLPEGRNGGFLGNAARE